MPIGASLSQLSPLTQSGPLVAWYSATRTSRSLLASIADTVTAMLADALPERTVMVAVPFFTAVTRP